MGFAKTVFAAVVSVAVLLVVALLVGEVARMLLGVSGIWHDPSLGLRRWVFWLPGM